MPNTLLSAYPLLGAYLLIIYTYKRIRLLAGVYGVSTNYNHDTEICNPTQPCPKTWSTPPKATHSPALVVLLPGVVQWKEGWGGYLCHVAQAHMAVLEVAGLILRGREGGGHCSFHCLCSITYQNLPRFWRTCTCTPFQSPPFLQLNRPYTIPNLSTHKTDTV